MNATSCGIPVIRGEPIPSIDEESSAAMNSGEASSLTLTATGGTQLSYEFSQSVQDMRDRDEKFRSSQLAQTQESLVQTANNLAQSVDCRATMLINTIRDELKIYEGHPDRFSAVEKDLLSVLKTHRDYLNDACFGRCATSSGYQMPNCGNTKIRRMKRKLGASDRARWT